MISLLSATVQYWCLYNVKYLRQSFIADSFTESRYLTSKNGTVVFKSEQKYITRLGRGELLLSTRKPNMSLFWGLKRLH